MPATWQRPGSLHRYDVENVEFIRERPNKRAAELASSKRNALGHVVRRAYGSDGSPERGEQLVRRFASQFRGIGKGDTPGDVCRQLLQPGACLRSQFPELDPATARLSIHADQETLRVADEQVVPVPAEGPAGCDVAPKRQFQHEIRET